MPTIYELAARHRAELLAGDEERARRQLAAYGRAWQGIRQELNATLAKLEAAQAAGEVPHFAGARVPGGPALAQPPGTHSVSWLYERRRLEHLEAVVRAELATYAEQLGTELADAQGEAVQLAMTHAAEQLAAAGAWQAAEAGVAAGFSRPTDRALAQLVGHLADGSPLEELLEGLPGDGAARFRGGLIDAVTQGLGPRQVASQVRDAMGGNFARALTVMRTEQLRTYREATRLGYEANSSVVAGWTWQAALDGSTCACCWAMHGTKHPNEERLDGHPNCRCSMVPYTRSWADLGADADETRADLEPGADAFARLDARRQYEVLGARKFDAYARGELDLADLVGRRDHPRWGSMRYERSLTELERLKRRGAVPRHLGDGLEPAKRHPAGAGAREIALADELGTTVDEVRELRATMARARAGVRAEARATQERALGQLEARLEGLAPTMKAPPRARSTTDALGRRRMARPGVGGEYDWLEQLSSDEQKRLRRFWLRHGDGYSGPDELAEAMARTGNYSSSANSLEGLEEWLELNRTADAAGALARGKLPAERAYSGQLELRNLAPESAGEGWDVATLFDADEARALDHVRGVVDDLQQQYVDRYGAELLEETLTDVRLAPWDMTASQYRQELDGIYRLFDAGDATDDDLRRLAELVPEDVWDAQRDLGPDELFRLVRRRRPADPDEF